MKKSIRIGLIVIAVLLCVVWALAQQAPPQQGPGGGQPGAGGQGMGQARGQGGPGAPGGAQAPQGRGGAPRTKKAVLAWADTRNGAAQHDSVSHALSVMERIGYESGTYDMYIRTDSNIISFKPKKTDGSPASGGPSLNNVDAIFFSGHRNVPLDDEGKADLVTFIKDQGKGFVACHVALTPWVDWPEMANILGSGYVGHVFGTQPNMTLVNESPDFPATKHFPATIALADEYYLGKDYSRDDIQVLLRLDISKFSPVSGYTRTDGDYPVAWAKMYGKGRVFYSSLGHDKKAWDNPDVSIMYFEAIKWALGLTPYELKPHPLPAGVLPPQGPPAPAREAPGGGAGGRQGAPGGAPAGAPPAR